MDRRLHSVGELHPGRGRNIFPKIMPFKADVLEKSKTGKQSARNQQVGNCALWQWKSGDDEAVVYEEQNDERNETRPHASHFTPLEVGRAVQGSVNDRV